MPREPRHSRIAPEDEDFDEMFPTRGRGARKPKRTTRHKHGTTRIRNANLFFSSSTALSVRRICEFCLGCTMIIVLTAVVFVLMQSDEDDASSDDDAGEADGGV